MAPDDLRLRGSRLHVHEQPAQPWGRLVAVRRGRAPLPHRSRSRAGDRGRNRPLQGRQHDRAGGGARRGFDASLVRPARAGRGQRPGRGARPRARRRPRALRARQPRAARGRGLPHGGAPRRARSPLHRRRPLLRRRARRLRPLEPVVRTGGHLLFHDGVDTGGYGNVYPGVSRAVAEVEQAGLFERLPGAGTIAHFVRAGAS